MNQPFAPRVLRAIGVAALALAFVAAESAAVTISESGSTLFYPLFRTWVAAYAKQDPTLHMSVAATGSGAGISEAIARHVQIGASDAYMTDDQKMAHPHVLNIPLAISAQTVDANLPGLQGHPLKLSGPVLADIYSGKITTWDANPIAALNRGLSLPHHAIVPVRRAEGSGDTFIFTQYLTFSTETADGGTKSWGDTIGYGTSVKWPSVSAVLTATGNEGMVQTIARTPYSVGYIGASYEDEAQKDRLVTAMLENQAGAFLLPTQDAVTAAVASLTPRTPPDERLTLVFAPGSNSYPLINYEYAIVDDHQSDSQTAQAVSNFLLWCISAQGGNAPGFLDPVHFVALPMNIRLRSEMQIAKIQ